MENKVTSKSEKQVKSEVPGNNNSSTRHFEFALQRENYILLAIGFVIIVIGFVLMSGGAVQNPNEFFPDNDPSKTPEIFNFQRITLAPMIVLFGFVFEIYAIMKKPKSRQ